jgi:hypothetical protein
MARETTFFETGTNEGLLIAVERGRIMPRPAVAARVRVIDSHGKTVEIEVEDIYALGKLLTRLAAAQVRDYVKDHAEDAHAWLYLHRHEGAGLNIPPKALASVREKADEYAARQLRT